MKKDNRQLWMILAIVFIGNVGISIPYLIFAPLFLNPSYTLLSPEISEAGRALSLGVALAIYPLGQFIGSPILGTLSDLHGRKRILCFSLIITCIATLATAVSLTHNMLWLLNLSRFIAGFMEGNTAIARAMAADIKTISREKSFGQINALTSIAYLLGPFIGAVVSAHAVALPFYYMFAILIGLTIFSALFLKPSPGLSKHSLNFSKRLERLFQNRFLFMLLMITTLFTLAVDIFYEFAPVHLTALWMLNPMDLLAYGGLTCIGLMIGSAVLPSFLKKKMRAQALIFTGIISFALSIFWIAFSGNVVVMLTLFAVSGVFIGLAVTLLTVNISSAAPDNIQGEVMGIQQSLRVLGDATICLLGGALLIISSKLILLLSAALAVITTIWYFSFVSSSKPTEHQES